jgi:hypothetical protein
MKNQIVTLRKFLGTTKAPKDTLEKENYWKLIGERGKIINDPENQDQVLVLFDSNLDDYNLENHNPIKNSLWISITDLEFKNGQ